MKYFEIDQHTLLNTVEHLDSYLWVLKQSKASDVKTQIARLELTIKKLRLNIKHNLEKK